jgi:hypothetical protein
VWRGVLFIGVPFCFCFWLGKYILDVWGGKVVFILFFLFVFLAFFSPGL